MNPEPLTVTPGDVGPAEATYGVADFWKLDDRLVPYPWMEFVHPNNGQLYFYNFKVSSRGGNHQMTTLAAPWFESTPDVKRVIEVTHRSTPLKCVALV